jgi:F-type H+-transporting ATPase subunit a
VLFEHLDTLITHSGAADSLRGAAGAAGEAGSGSAIFGELLHHVQDSHEIDIPFGRIELPHFAPVTIGNLSIDLSITKHVVFVWLAAVIVAAVAIMISRRYRKAAVPSGFSNVIESVVVYIRDEVGLANMGSGGRRYMPYVLTVFFFILTMNLLGLLPYGASATGNISVTAGLAVISFIMIQYSAIRAQGFRHYLAHLTGGVHWLLWPIMVPIEVMGLFTKNFALCMRLFANMIGGHIVILSFLGLIFLFKSYYVAPASLGFALGVSMLELFVAFLQAYIFTMLTTLFMGLGIQAGHQDGEGHDH